MHAFSIDVKSDSIARPTAFLSTVPGHHINVAIFYVDKPVRSEVLDQVDVAVDPPWVIVCHVKIFGTNAQGQSLSSQPRQSVLQQTGKIQTQVPALKRSAAIGDFSEEKVHLRAADKTRDHDVGRLVVNVRSASYLLDLSSI